ncbi:carbohydrate ABC transporter permease [Microbacterium sp. CFBP 8794]|uniref:carbohydrate ABC transporter permease n=1 Tax=Microbacterium sp. CFBP 8794 TaxID=2775269 RepID=UPI0031403B1F
MTALAAAAAAADPLQGRRQPPQRRAANRRVANRNQTRMSYVFISGYTLLTIAFGLLPTLYALFLSVTKEGRFVGLDNFVRVIDDFRFWPAVSHVGVFLVVWLVALLVLVVFLAVAVHAIGVRWLSSSLRFLYYVPGAIAGASSVVLWLFVLDPSVSPVSGLLQLLGFETLVQTVAPANLPAVFAVIAFWSGAGGWIVVVYGALNNIPTEVMEASRIDGAGAWQTAIHIQLPMLKKWISYMAIMSLAAGTQLFVEPKVLSQATKGVVPTDYSLNQLAYQYAFKFFDSNGSAAIAVLLLVVSLGLSIFFVIKGGLFDRD